MEPGKPLLPSKKVLIALPPGAKVESADIQEQNLKQMPGKFNIVPAEELKPNV